VSGCGIVQGRGQEDPGARRARADPGSESEIAADKTLNGVDVLLPEAAVNDGWRQPGGNAAKAMGHLALGDSLNQAWRRTIAGSNQARAARRGAGDRRQQALCDGRTDGAVHALCRGYRRRVWTTKTSTEKKKSARLFGGGVSAEGEASSPATAGRRRRAQCQRTATRSGASVPGGPLRGSPTLANGNAYVVTPGQPAVRAGAG
jgi:outer membrane protein assembly factor BamB